VHHAHVLLVVLTSSYVVILPLASLREWRGPTWLVGRSIVVANAVRGAAQRARDPVVPQQALAHLDLGLGCRCLLCRSSFCSARCTDQGRWLMTCDDTV